MSLLDSQETSEHDFGKIDTLRSDAFGFILLVITTTKNGVDKTENAILMSKPRSKFLLYGKLDFSFLAGFATDITGASLKAGRCTIPLASPASHTPLTISFLDGSDGAAYQPLDKNLFDNFAREVGDEGYLSVLQGCVNSKISLELFKGNPCIAWLKKLPSRLHDSLCRIQKLAKLFSFEDEEFAPKAPFNRLLGFSLEPVSFSDRAGFCLTPELVEAADQCIRGKAALVAGPKNSGKSTFVRYLVNRCLSAGHARVALLDVDVGQPELTPSGMLSLHLIEDFLLGPPVCSILHGSSHRNRPLRACFFGALTPTDNADYYLACMNFVHEAYGRLPGPPPILIVNPKGWTTNLGLDLLVEQIALTRPDMIVQLETKNDKLNLPRLDQAFLRQFKTFSRRVSCAAAASLSSI